MKNTKVKDVEEFIGIIEKGIYQFEEAIKKLNYYGNSYKIPIEILVREQKEMERQLQEFKEKTLGELTGDDEISSFNKLIAYKEMLNRDHNN